jgi:uncharacterized protein (TIGR00725 family)
VFFILKVWLILIKIYMKSNKKLQIGVIGSAGQEEYPEKLMDFKKLNNKSYIIGQLLAKAGVILITGGKGGVMESAAKGAKEFGGITVGIVKGSQRYVSNKFVDVEIITGMFTGGSEFIQPFCCDALIVIGGGAGTLQEITVAYRNSIPIVVLRNSGGWSGVVSEYLDERRLVRIIFVDTPERAVSTAVQLANKNKGDKNVMAGKNKK